MKAEPPWFLGFVLIAVLVMLAAPFLRPSLRGVITTSAKQLPLNFPHEQHVDVPCTLCHHNYVDKTGMLSCIECHRSAPNLMMSVQPRFHQFCRACHIKQGAAGKPTGPIGDCDACHRQTPDQVH